MRLPENFEKKMRDLLKEDFDDYIACYEEPRYYGLRVNTNKISVEEFKKICPFEIEPIPWIENGFYYDGEHELRLNIHIILQGFIICRSQVP